MPSRFQTSAANQASRSGLTLIEVLVSVAILAVLAVLMMTGVGGIRQSAAQTQCIAQMRNIGVAFSQYVAENGHYPGRGPIDESDNAAHKKRWFAQLAIYMGHPAGDTYEGISVSEDHPYSFSEFVCPAHTLWANPPNPDGYGHFGRYGYNPRLLRPGMRGVPAAMVSRPASVVLLAEKFDHRPSFVLAAPFPEQERGVSANHRKDNDPRNGPDGPSNYLFADGHVETHTGWIGSSAFELDP